MKPEPPFRDYLIERGIAKGWSDIKRDEIHFEFGEEKFRFPTIALIPHIAKFNGYFYEAKVEELRKLSKKNENG